MATPATLPDDAPPSVRKPSQAYVDRYISQRNAPPGVGTTPAEVPASPRARHAPRIFYRLEHKCPEHYYARLHTTSQSSRSAMRAVLLLLCIVQLAVALGILYATEMAQFLHDPFHEYFTAAVAALCAFAACAGFVGVCASSRPMLLLLYINQLWSLSNVSTFAVIFLTSETQSATACRLFASGELSPQQLRDQGLDCDDVARTARLLGTGLLSLILLLWAVCFFSKLYSEMLQDAQNDGHDAELINFVWQRRGETWAKLEKFEDVVQRQFEELRMSLVAHAHHAQASAGQPSPRCGGASPRSEEGGALVFTPGVPAGSVGR